MAIVEFKQDLEYFFHTACEFNDNGDFVSCLDYLRTALQISQEEYDQAVKEFGSATDDSLDNLYSVKAEIAATYCEMELYNESIKQYYKMYDCPDDFKDELFFGLVKNYTMLNMPTQAAYYLTYGIEKGYLDPGEGVSKEELISSLKGELPFSLVPKNGDLYAIDMAKQFISSGNSPKYARQLLSNIEPSSESYVTALGLLALLETSQRHNKKALEYANKALEISPTNVNALCIKIMLLSAEKQSDELSDALSDALDEELKKTYDTLQHAEVNSLEDATRAATAMANINNNELVLKYTNICLEYIPFDAEIGMMNALALANLGQKDESKRQFVRLQKIYPDNMELKFLARMVGKSDGDKKFSLLGLNAMQEGNDIYLNVDNFWSEAKTIFKAVKLIKKDPEMMEKIEFVYQYGDVELVECLSNMLPQSKYFDKFINQKLIDPNFPIICKKDLLFNKLFFGDNEQFTIVVNNIIHEFKPKRPVCMSSENAYEAYWLVYAALAFVETNFDTKLNAACKNLFKKYPAFSAFECNIVAAIIAYKSKCSKIFTQTEYCAEIFGCDRQEFELALTTIKNGAIL